MSCLLDLPKFWYHSVNEITQKVFNMKKLLLLSAVTASAIFFAACGSSSDDSVSSSSSNSEQSSSSTSSIDTTSHFYKASESLATVTLSDGNEIDTSLPLGSGVSHYSGDANNIVYFVTNRGPVVNCNNDTEMVGSDICASGEAFLNSDFTPFIVKAEIKEDSITILEKIAMKDSNGNALNGLSPSKNYTLDAYNQDGNALTHNIDGINPGAIVKTKDGFYIADEYTPSILNVTSDGTVVERLVPTSVTEDFAQSGYTAVNALYDITTLRAENRGISALAIDDTQSRLFYMMEAPLNNPDSTKSQNVRLFVYSLESGSVKEYWYKLDATGNTIGDMTFIKDSTLLVSEQSASSTKLYQIDLIGAVEVYSEMNKITNDDFEAISDDSFTADTVLPDERPPMVPLTKTELLDSASNASIPNSITGIANMGSDRYLLTNTADSIKNGAADIASIYIEAK